MATPRDWADAFLTQASEDLAAAQATYEAGVSSSFCMLVQMVFEKLATAAIARRVADPEDRIAADLLKTAHAFVRRFDALFP